MSFSKILINFPNIVQVLLTLHTFYTTEHQPLEQWTVNLQSSSPKNILSPCKYLFFEESFITDAYWLCCLCLVMPFCRWITKAMANCFLFLFICARINITIALMPLFQQISRFFYVQFHLRLSGLFTIYRAQWKVNVVHHNLLQIFNSYYYNKMYVHMCVFRSWMRDNSDEVFNAFFRIYKYFGAQNSVVDTVSKQQHHRRSVKSRYDWIL